MNDQRNSKAAEKLIISRELLSSSFGRNQQQRLQQLVFACALMLALMLANNLVETSPVSTTGISDGGQQPTAGMNNLENLISDFLDDAGNRLKKSKLNSMRQIKQTLRFGRRSDPFMSPGGGLSEQLSLDDELESARQRQLLAAALASD